MASLFWQAAEVVAPEATHRRRAGLPVRPSLVTLEELWVAAGLSDVRVAELVLTQEFASFEDFWLPFLDGATPTGEFAVAVNRETRGEVAGVLRRIIPDIRPDGSFALPARALAVAGVAHP
jgi:hypothetical protein